MYRHVQEIRTQMVVRFRDRRLWLGVQMQKDVSILCTGTYRRYERRWL